MGWEVGRFHKNIYMFSNPTEIGKSQIPYYEGTNDFYIPSRTVFTPLPLFSAPVCFLSSVLFFFFVLMCFYHVVCIWQGIHEAVTMYTRCCLWKLPHQETNQFIRRCHPCARKSASKVVLRSMQPTLSATRPTPHGASRLVRAMTAWLVKTRRAPSQCCRGARVHGQTTITTTAIHDMSTPPPRPQTRYILMLRFKRRRR